MTDRTVDIVEATAPEGAVTETALAPLGGRDPGIPRRDREHRVRHHLRGADHRGNSVATSG
ncbi:hypothetical protein [Nocardia abscessus]|uniref:hypothetical protein n=1 Tax=Nocardia abscessus TaxID=120957 RepID=UPI002455AFC9|nr:hypothetical protein [Nocardia abscessus]